MPLSTNSDNLCREPSAFWMHSLQGDHSPPGGEGISAAADLGGWGAGCLWAGRAPLGLSLPTRGHRWSTHSPASCYKRNCNEGCSWVTRTPGSPVPALLRSPSGRGQAQQPPISHLLLWSPKGWKEGFPRPLCLLPPPQRRPAVSQTFPEPPREPGRPPGQQARSLKEGRAAAQQGPHALLFQGAHQVLAAESQEQQLHGFDRDPGRRWDPVRAWQHPRRLRGASAAPRSVTWAPDTCWASLRGYDPVRDPGEGGLAVRAASRDFSPPGGGDRRGPPGGGCLRPRPARALESTSAG